jgi:hypothetical protein
MEKLINSVVMIVLGVGAYMTVWSWDKPQEYAAFKAKYFQSATVSVEDSLSPGEVIVTKPSKKVEAAPVKHKAEKPFNLVKAIFVTAMLLGMAFVIIFMLYALRELRGFQMKAVAS